MSNFETILELTNVSYGKNGLIGGEILELYYKEYGNKHGDLMVFLHGGGVSGWMWDQQIPYFTDYHCVVIDLPGQGKSLGTEPFSIRTSAAKINELIQSIAHEKEVIVIGFSLGAQVLIQMLSLEPNLIDAAIVNSALVRPSGTFIKKMIRPSIKMTFPLVKIKSFSKIQAKTLYIDDAQFDTYFEESSRMNPDTLINILEENMSFEVPDSFQDAQGRILVTAGGKEKSIMKKSASDIVFRNINCTGIIIPHVGHGIPMADPTYFNHMVANWVKDDTLPNGVEELK